MHKFNNLDIYDVNDRNRRIKYMAIKNIYPNVITRRGDLVYDKDENLISMDEALVKTEYDKLLAEYDALDYARKRKSEYPNIYDYMDGIVKNDQTQIDKYITPCIRKCIRLNK